MKFKSLAALLLSATLALNLGQWTSVPVHAASDLSFQAVAVSSNRAANVVISEFYGGHTSATSKDLIYRNDFVELFNPTASTIDLNGWSLQFAEAKATSWQTVELSGEIKPYGFYLIKLKDNNGPSAEALPLWDAADETLDLNNKAGKLALMSTTEPFAGIKPATAETVDYVSYGNVSDFLSDEFNGSAPVPEAGQKNTMQRHIYNPLNPGNGLEAVNLPHYGNDWNTGDGYIDFAKNKPGNPHASDTVAEPRAYLAADGQFEMSTATKPSESAVSIEIAHGFVKENPVYGADFEIAGLPAGLTASAAGNTDGLLLTLEGEASDAVTTDALLSVTLHETIWDNKQPASARPALSLQSGSHTLQLKGFVSDDTIVGALSETTAALQWDNSRTSLAEGHDRFVIGLSNGTAVDGALENDAYTVSGMPDGLEIQASGDSATNSVQFVVTGNAGQAVRTATVWSVTLHDGAVQENAFASSAPIAVSLRPYTDASGERKALLEGLIKESNSYFMNPIMKIFKYSEETQGKNGFNLYRGTPEAFYNDLGTALMPLPESWSSLDSLATWIEGDAHLQNVGVLNNGEFSADDTTRNGNAIFDLNDYDSAYIAPFYWDLLRMIPSLYLERDQASSGTEMAALSNEETRQLAAGYVKRYYEVMSAIADKSLPLDTELNAAFVENGFTKDLLVKSGAIARSVNVADETTANGEGGRMFKLTKKSGNKYWTLTASEREAFEAAWKSYVERNSLWFPSEIAGNANYFAIKDVVYRINQGNASIGSKRYNVLIEGPTDSWEDDILIDVKEEFWPDMFQSNSSFEPDSVSYQNAYGDNHAKRAVEAYRTLAVNPDPFLGTLELDGAEMMVKAIPVSKYDYTDFIRSGSFENKNDFADYLKYTATAYALAHARAAVKLGNDQYAAQVVSALDVLSSETFARDITEIGENYYLQVNADFDQLRDDLRTGKLVDIRHLTKLTVSQESPAGEESLVAEKFGAAEELAAVSGSVATEELALTPAFSSMHPYPSYSAEWPILNFKVQQQGDVSAVRIAAGAADPQALVSIGGFAAEIGESQREVTLNDSKLVEVVVTARDGSTMTYSLSFADGGSGEENEEADRQAVELTLQQLAVGYASGDSSTSVTKELALPLEGAAGTSISWTSDNGAIKISGDKGPVTRPSASSSDIQVTLTAVIQKGSISETKTFLVTVKKLPSSPDPGNGSGSDGNGSNPGNGSGTGGNGSGSGDNGASPTPTPTPNPDPADDTAGENPQGPGSDGNEPDGNGAGETVFKDTTNHWAANTISRAVQLGFINGYGDGSFKPDQQISRAEFAVLLARLLGWDNDEQTGAFTDESTIKNWAIPAVKAAAVRGVITGYSDGSFQPNKAINRAEMAVMIARSLNLSQSAEDGALPLRDANSIPVWAKGAVDASFKAGLLTGRTSGNFDPGAPATRAEAVVILLRALDSEFVASP
ncbi:DUF2252 family protein [Paenibacillus sp. CAU 1782]